MGQSQSIAVNRPEESEPRPRPASARPPAPGMRPLPAERPRVEGKFLCLGDEKFWVRGVTYGTFRPDEQGEEYDRAAVGRDFAAMAANGFNAVRTYTVPPRWILDVAETHGLRVMVGLPWEQHVAFLDERWRVRDIVERVRAGVRQCAGHPAVLCYAIGNEIPAPIVRWYGPRPIERFLRRLYRACKEEDPDALVTYVNYPTTEYLDLSFVDFLSFNVYLETRERLAAYLARLQNIAGEMPVVMAEVGLDSLRNGAETQAEVLDWQIRTCFAAACSGAFIFAWTDEWHRGGHDIEDWDFGLTTREREPKPALAAVREAFEDVPFPAELDWPEISVVVCSHNGARTIRDTLEGLARIDYPDYEVIVVDDGSTDDTARIAAEFDVRVISTENRGLSSARNTGYEAARGGIVAYIDDDAWPDRDWLKYLAWTFMNTDHAGVGGPNIAPAGDGEIADCVANAPGGPVHVLRTDEIADHIPGCNMAFRKDRLEAVGGFDPRYRAAGDDVDLCWRLQDRGWSIGFSPGAMVWHHRRNSIRHYWRQQQGYGKAEALLEGKWPERYNAAGHLAWAGRIYGKGLTRAIGFGPGRIYQGTWGSAPFQSLYQAAPGMALSLPLMPEWYLVLTALAGLALVGLAWTPLLAVALPLLLVAVAASIAQAVLSAAQATYKTPGLAPPGEARLRAVTALLHLLQPLARLIGRLRHGLTPWRGRGGWTAPRPREVTIWCEEWMDGPARLEALEAALRDLKAPAWRGGDYDRWDMAARGGLLGGVRARMTVEEHGAGRQLLRFRIWPIASTGGILSVLAPAAVAVVAAFDGAGLATMLLGAGALAMAGRLLLECGSAQALTVDALARCKEKWTDV